MYLKAKLYLLVSIFIFCNTSALAVDAPLNPRGTEIGQLKVKWEWDPVFNADEYQLVVDGVKVYVTRSTEYFSYNLWAGEHSLTVRAKTHGGEISEPTPTAKIMVSDWFSAASYNRSFIVGQQSASPSRVQFSPVKKASVLIQKPAALASAIDVRGEIISADTIQWSWSSVDGAQTYEVTVDGSYVGTTHNLSFISADLWKGDHSVTVIAVSAIGTRSAQSNTAKLWLAAKSLTADSERSEGGADSKVGITSAPPIKDNDVETGLLSMVDPASLSHSEVFNKAGYDLVFSDEFEGDSLNSLRWNTGLRWDGEHNGERYEYRVINGEDQFYVNIFSEDEEHVKHMVPSHNPFELDGSRLAIRAIKNPIKTNNNDLAYGSMKEMASQQEFLSGAIATHDKFSQKFGYFEARIKIPSHVGTFPAFWLFHESSVLEGTQKTEIDIMENLGHAPWYVYNTFHYYKNVSVDSGGEYNLVKPYPDGQIFTGVDYSLDYHVYAVEWEPGKITWFIDGEKVSEFESVEVNFEELYLKLNLAIGGQWTSYPTNAGGLGRDYPNQTDLDGFKNPALEIDYVRVYKKQEANF